MYRITKNDIGAEFTVTLKLPPGKVVVETMILAREEGRYFLCHNLPTLDSGHRINNQYGKQFTYGLGNTDFISRDNVPHMMTIVKERSTVLFKASDSGTLFRYIHKIETDENLIYLGSIHKDIEDCKNPSAVVSVMDYRYVQSIGWKVYKAELPAEKRVQIT